MTVGVYSPGGAYPVSGVNMATVPEARGKRDFLCLLKESIIDSITKRLEVTEDGGCTLVKRNKDLRSGDFSFIPLYSSSRQKLKETPGPGPGGPSAPGPGAGPGSGPDTDIQCKSQSESTTRRARGCCEQDPVSVEQKSLGKCQWQVNSS